METIFKLILLVVAALALGIRSLYFVHMLQLNSYRPERYSKWCKENDSRLVNWRALLPALLLPAMYLSARYGYAVGIGVLVVTVVLNFPKKAKKPLVFTARVRRLLAALFGFYLLILVLCWFLDSLRCTGFVALLSLLPWFWVGLANRAMLPLEKHIANGFVRDARRRLDAMPELTVIGITGSYGKTSTKNFLHALLSVRYNVLMTPESYNTTMGVVRTVRERLKPSHEIFIAEMGAKNPGDIREICDLVTPQYGILTSVGEQHLETFKTLDAIINTKFELAEALPENGCLLANGDNPHIRGRLEEAKLRCPVVTYGLENGDFTAVIDKVDTTGCRFTVTVCGKSQVFTTKLLGAHNIQNLVGCIAMAVRLGIPMEELVYPVRLLRPVEHRLQLLPNGFIDDAYNSNPAGFRGALDVLSQFDAQRVLVTPGMVELGERQEALNRELGAYAADKCDYAILVGERQAPPLKDGLLSAGFPEERLFVVKTLQDGLTVLSALPRAEKRIVLLENDLPDNF